MRHDILGAILAMSLAASSAVVAGQTPAPAWKPSRTPDGQPDIQGYWGQRNNVTTYSLERGEGDRAEHIRITGQRAATGKPIVDPPDGRIPFQPWAAEKYQYLLDVHLGPTRIQDLDPVARGFLEGTPRINLQTGFEILQPPGYVVFLYEYGHHYRVIPLDGRPHLPTAIELWMGDSRGRWEGATLVVDVTNHNDQTWFDQVGAFHRPALHVVERWTFVGPDAIDYEATIEDPRVFTRPWKIAMNYRRNTDQGYEQMESAVWGRKPVRRVDDAAGRRGDQDREENRKRMRVTPTHGNEQGTDYLRTRIDRVQARSVVMSALGVVASEHPLASQAGATLLARGGHAVDAAIAANAVMGVVAPMMNGVGGDLFAIVYEAASGRAHGLNASGWAPAGLTLELLQARGIDGMPQSGIHSVTVPGAVSGWAALRDRFGRKPLSDILAPAIYHAESGFPVSEITACEWAGSAAALRSDASASKTFLRGGRPPCAGEIFSNRDLAWTYRQIAVVRCLCAIGRRGRAPSLMCSAQHGGTLAASDLAEFEAEWVSPFPRRIAAGRLRAAAERAGHRRADDAQPPGALADRLSTAHNSVEALAHADRSEEARLCRHGAATCATRDFMTCSRRRRCCRRRTPQSALRQIDPAQRAMPTLRRHAADASGGDTIYLSVVDRDGNMVSLIQSNFANFGSGLVPDGDGLRAAEPRRAVHAGPGAPQCARAAQAPAPHDHSRVHAAKATVGAIGVRHHGRLEPVAGPCAVRLERRRSRDEHSGGARGRRD